MTKNQYRSQAARDAARYGERYARRIEQSALKRYEWYAGHGLQIAACRVLTKSLSEFLSGNDGE